MVAGAGSNFSFRNRWANPTSLRDRAVAARALGKLRLDVRFGSLADIATAMKLVRFVTEAEIKHAIFAPPEDTRAYFRGRSVARFNSRIKSIQWDEIVFANGASPQRVQLAEPHDNPRLAALNTAAREAADYRQFICAVAAL